MKLCDTCIYRNENEYHKPCIVYRDDCEFYEKERGDMTREKAIEIIKCGDIYNRWGNDGKEVEQMAIKTLEQEPCGDAISRQAVLDALYELCDTGETLIENPWRDNPHIDVLVDAIEELPPVNPQEPKTGHWIYKQFDEETGISNTRWCSECNKPLVSLYKDFCSNCGARMEIIDKHIKEIEG